MKSLRISEIRTDAGTQIRVRLDDATVAEYAEAYKDGAKFPPVIVFHDGSEYILADGFHRVMGANSAGFKDVLADVRKGTRTDALKYALSANSNHGLKRTNADKRRAVEIALKEFPKDADRSIATICDVSHTLVSEMRKSLETTGRIASSSTRIGADGKERKLPTTPPPIKPSPAKLSPPPIVKPTQKKSAPPVVEPVAIKDKTGFAIPKNLLPLWERSHEAQELLTALSRIKGALREAQESKDALYIEVNFASALAQLDQAYADIKTAIPFAVCPTCQGKASDSCRLCKGRGFISEHRWSTVVPKETKELRAKAKS